jgi:glycosyltransferase involved in cell wall biosynthesis
MMMPMISVAIASYNGERYIAEQLDSILAQECESNFEVVVSDDCSSDGTVSILELYAARYPSKVRVLTSSKNEGIRKNFEKAIRACNGELIAISDQDDWWHPRKLRVLSELLRGNVTLSFSDMDVVDENLSGLGFSLWDTLRLSPRIERAISGSGGYKLLLKANRIAGCTLMARHDFLLSCLPFSDFYLHDEWIATFAAVLGSIIPCRERLSSYRQHQSQQVGAGEPPFFEALAFLPDAKSLAIAAAGRRELVQRLDILGADPKKLAHIAEWTNGRTSAEQRRYIRFSIRSFFGLLLDGSYFKYLSGPKAIGKDILRLLRAGFRTTHDNATD